MVTLDQGGAHNRVVKIVPPPAALTPYVEHLWFDGTPGGATAWRVVPDDAAYVILSLSDGTKGAAVRLLVVGPRARYCDIDRGGRVATVGARLRPGALPSLFRVSGSELTDSAISATELTSLLPRDTEERFQASIQHDACEDLVRVVSLLASRARSLDARAQLLGNASSQRIDSVDTLVAATGLSYRGARRWAQCHFGFGLKRVSRIRCVHQALREHAADRGGTWTKVAHRCGYADLAHLSRDFHDLLGEPPSQFIARGKAAESTVLFKRGSGIR